MLPPDVLSLARLHRLRQQQIAQLATAGVRKLWRYMGSGAITGGWLRIAPLVQRLVISAQMEAARGVQDYVATAIRLQGVEADPVGDVATLAFAGVAADGRDLAGLLGYPAFEASAFIDQGMAPAQALEVGGRHLERIVATETADAARVATGVAIVNDRKTRGWVRMLTPPSCSRCVILAGQWYAYNKGFERHPQCFPAGTVVSGPGADGAARRWYQGELVVIRTASGKNLAVTANHPILTSQGWLPANLLREGSDVVSRAVGDRSGALVVPDHDQMPTRIEDLWRSNAMSPLGRMPVAAEDFHGDGFGSSHVDVVLADRLLRDWREAATLQEFGEVTLTGRAELSVALARSGAREQLGIGDLAELRGMLCRHRLGGSLRLRHLAHANQPGLARSADDCAGIHEAFADDGTTDVETIRQGVLALTRDVRGHEGWDVNVAVAPRWDAPAAAFTEENRAAYASRGHDLVRRLAGQVHLDCVVEVRSTSWSGHVYNLTSREGWYDANGIIVSNCDCIHVPAAEVIEPESPRAVFDAMSDDELKRAGWSDADVRAIREDGADIYQVTNAHRDLRSVTLAGQQLKATGHGATRRGLAGKRLGRGGKRQAVRLTPESIYAESQRLGWSRDETIRVLKLHGYIL